MKLLVLVVLMCAVLVNVSATFAFLRSLFFGSSDKDYGHSHSDHHSPEEIFGHHSHKNFIRQKFRNTPKPRNPLKSKDTIPSYPSKMKENSSQKPKLSNSNAHAMDPNDTFSQKITNDMFVKGGAFYILNDTKTVTSNRLNMESLNTTRKHGNQGGNQGRNYSRQGNVNPWFRPRSYRPHGFKN